MKRTARSIFSAFALASFTSACGVETTTPVNKASDTAASEDAIIGGIEITGKSMDAVGSISIIDPETGEHFSICTGALIGKHTVLTAKHCAAEIGFFGTAKYLDYYEMAFDLGNWKNPTKSYPFVDVKLAPKADGGAIGYGSDVAVYFISEEVTDAAPLPFTSPTENLLGSKGTAIGYGAQNNAQAAGEPTDGSRKGGAITLDALGGNFYSLAFGWSYEDFLGNLVATYGQEVVDECLADPTCAPEVQAMWDSSNLIPQYEFWTERKAGDVQPCFGDSGGPLLKKITKAGTDETERYILGVASWLSGSDDLACDYGLVYATFGPTTFEFLTESKDWTDPCAGTTVQGTCEGTVATRCTGRGEGPRAKTVVDCASVEQVCVISDAGFAQCADDASDTAATPRVTKDGRNPDATMPAHDDLAGAIFGNTVLNASPAAMKVRDRLSK